jgi:hypothetical protein
VKKTEENVAKWQCRENLSGRAVQISHLKLETSLLKMVNVYPNSILAIDTVWGVNKYNPLLTDLTLTIMDLNKIPDRNVLYPRDIENIMGRSRRTGRRIARMIREAYGKAYHGWVPFKEFCDYFQMKEEEVRKYLN